MGSPDSPQGFEVVSTIPLTRIATLHEDTQDMSKLISLDGSLKASHLDL